MTQEAKVVHAPGECPWSSIPCDGIAEWTTDPFAEEIYGQEIWDWRCDGELYESAMDI